LKDSQDKLIPKVERGFSHRQDPSPCKSFAKKGVMLNKLSIREVSRYVKALAMNEEASECAAEEYSLI
jgi:hypothetical protein